MNASSLPPWVWFFAAACLLPLLRRRTGKALLLATPLLGAACLLLAPDGALLEFSLFGIELTPYRLDPLSRVFALLFHFAALMGLLFALHVRDRMQHAAALAYIGGALMAVCAGDLVTLFLAWEAMAVSSTFLIWARRTQAAFTAGCRYLAAQLLSGLLLLTGLLWRIEETGAAGFDYIGLDNAAGWLIFLAFGIKCAFPLLHNWLTDAYPEATPTGTVFLCIFTTKVAVYAMVRGFPGSEPLLYLGVVMACFPIFYAVIENDLRRVLAYSMINQLGFMVCGVGTGAALGLAGSVAHACNDVLFKGLLFMSMGAVLQATGRCDAAGLGGLYRSMPRTAFLCVVGAASISAFPLFNGFVSKSLIMEAVLVGGHPWLWLALLFASAGVFHHAGIKIPFFAFFGHDSGIRGADPPANMLLAMAAAALLCVLIGCFPGALYALLPFPVAYSPYETGHVVAQLQLLCFSALAFVWLRQTGLYPPELPSVNLDAEWTYRRLLPAVWRRAATAASMPQRALKGALAALQTHGAARGRRLLRFAVRGDYATSGAAALGSLAALAALILLYYLGQAA